MANMNVIGVTDADLELVKSATDTFRQELEAFQGATARLKESLLSAWTGEAAELFGAGWDKLSGSLTENEAVVADLSVALGTAQESYRKAEETIKASIAL